MPIIAVWMGFLIVSPAVSSAEDSRFMGWSGGGCSGTGPNQLTQGAEPTTVKAQFDPYHSTTVVPTFSLRGLVLFAILTAASTLWILPRRSTVL